MSKNCNIFRFYCDFICFDLLFLFPFIVNLFISFSCAIKRILNLFEWEFFFKLNSEILENKNLNSIIFEAKKKCPRYFSINLF